MKIIYIYERRFAYKGDFESFGYDIFLEKKYEVEVWSLMEWLFGKTTKDIPRNISLDNDEYVHYIRSEEDFLENLQRVKNEEVFFLCYPYHAFGEKSFLIRRLLNNYDMPFANITESIPICELFFYHIPMNKVSALLRILRNVIVRNGYYAYLFLVSGFRQNKYKQEIVDSFYRIFGYLFYPSVYNFVTTEVAYYTFPNPFEKWSDKNVLISAESYTEYVRNLDNDSDLDNYIVFIDQGLIKRNEVFSITYGDVLIKNEQKYCTDLCMLFDILEFEYNCEVVIAAHPKSNYDGSEFGNRKIIYRKTAELIKNAKLVINQFSTALGLVIMYKKPFIDICTKEMYGYGNGEYKKTYRCLEKLFNCKVIDISDYGMVKDFKKYIVNYDTKIYEHYKSLAIKSESSIGDGKRFYEVVYDNIEKWRENNI